MTIDHGSTLDDVMTARFFMMLVILLKHTNDRNAYFFNNSIILTRVTRYQDGGFGGVAYVAGNCTMTIGRLVVAYL